MPVMIHCAVGFTIIPVGGAYMFELSNEWELGGLERLLLDGLEKHEYHHLEPNAEDRARHVEREESAPRKCAGLEKSHQPAGKNEEADPYIEKTEPSRKNRSRSPIAEDGEGDAQVLHEGRHYRHHHEKPRKIIQEESQFGCTVGSISRRA